MRRKEQRILRSDDMVEPTTFLTVADITSKALRIINKITNKIKNAEINRKILELHSIILALQEQLSILRNNHDKIVQIKNNMEEKLKSKEDWKVEKTIYEKLKLPTNTIVFILKSPKDETEKGIYFCAKCFNDQKASILQTKTETNHGHVAYCPECKNEFITRDSDLTKIPISSSSY